MDKRRLETFRKNLEAQQEKLRKMVAQIESYGREQEEQTQDPADRAANSYNKEFLFSQSNNERARLAQITKAIARIREGNFGDCEQCGEEINTKRLEAVPWARYCINCQEKIEQGQMQEVRP